MKNGFLAFFSMMFSGWAAELEKCKSSILTFS